MRFGRQSTTPTTPGHLYGHARADYAMVSTRWLVGAWMRLWEQTYRYQTRETGPSRLDVEVAARTEVADDGSVVEVALRSRSGDPLPHWSAGAHIRVLLPSGRVREYSLCGSLSDTAHYRIAVRRLSENGASAEVHGLDVGDHVRITRPSNAFPLALPGHGSTASSLHFIAGGIGITPILPMIETAERHGVRWSLTYVGRTRDSLAFLDRLAHYGDRVVVRTDDERGVPTPAELLDGVGTDTALYCCGPTALTDTLLAEPEMSARCGELHFERFSLPRSGGREFTVTIGSDERSVAVSGDESMLAALERAMPSITYSCRQGFCGTCKLRVVDGDIEHADTVLTDHERGDGYMLPCVSRASGDKLVIDL